jgi:hypothetical protein
VLQIIDFEVELKALIPVLPLSPRSWHTPIHDFVLPGFFFVLFFIFFGTGV